MLKFIYSGFLFFSATLALCQEEAAPEEEVSRNRFSPYELKIGINLIRSGRTLLGSGITTHELQAALGVDKFHVVLDLGIEENRYGETYEYTNQGGYYRIGFDRNFSKNKSSGNALTLGLRYARAGFNDQLSLTTDRGFGEETYLFGNDDLSARWFEVVLGIRGKIVANLYTGFSLRWQTFRSIKGEGQLKTYDIPGFGKTRRLNATAFDYYLMWRIPFE